MYFISCQPESSRFKWELEVYLTNLNALGDYEIILLFLETEEEGIAAYLAEKYDHVTCYIYKDKRVNSYYLSSLRPYLWMQFLKENPEMSSKEYFYLDTDIIFREMVDFSKLKVDAKHWLGSECKSYISPQYNDQYGSYYNESMADVIGISMAQVEKFNESSPGAQWLISQPTYEFWEKVYHDSESIYLLLLKYEQLPINRDRVKDTMISKWMSDMWALLWNTAYFGIEAAGSEELSFSWSPSPASDYEKHKILHNAGVLKKNAGEMFFKGDYIKKSPFDEVLVDNPEYCSYYYVQAIKKVIFEGEINED